MATKGAAAAATEPNGDTKPAFEAPPTGGGWEDSSTPDVEGWFVPKTGAIFTGTIVGMIRIEDEKRPGMTRDVVLVKLKKPCANATQDSKDVTLQEGQVLAVGVRAKLTSLLEYVENKGECWVQAKNERKLTKGRTLWEFDVRTKGKKGPIPQVQPRMTAPAGASEGF